MNCVINFHENSIGGVLQNLNLILGSSLRKMFNFFYFCGYLQERQKMFNNKNCIYENFSNCFVIANLHVGR